MIELNNIIERNSEPAAYTARWLAGILLPTAIILIVYGFMESEQNIIQPAFLASGAVLLVLFLTVLMTTTWSISAHRKRALHDVNAYLEEHVIPKYEPEGVVWQVSSLSACWPLLRDAANYLFAA